MADEPLIRQYIAPGGIGWVLALVALVLCIVFYFMGGKAAPMDLFLIGLVAASRLC